MTYYDFLYHWAHILSHKVADAFLIKSFKKLKTDLS